MRDFVVGGGGQQSIVNEVEMLELPSGGGKQS